jgi:UDP-perosamine 4-acetyltransferase
MDVVIVGAGGHGKVVLEILRAAGQHKPVGFLDADPSLAGSTVAGLTVLGYLNALPKIRSKAKGAIVAIGDNRVRVGYARKLHEAGFELINAVHPSAVISPSAIIGQNVVIAANAVIGTAAKVGDSAIINTSAVVDHECEIGEAAHICPAVALAGRVRIGEGAFVGIGSRVIPCTCVGAHATVGAGAVIIKDVPANATVVGVPGRVIKITAG